VPSASPSAGFAPAPRHESVRGAPPSARAAESPFEDLLAATGDSVTPPEARAEAPAPSKRPDEAQPKPGVDAQPSSASVAEAPANETPPPRTSSAEERDQAATEVPAESGPVSRPETNECAPATDAVAAEVAVAGVVSAMAATIPTATAFAADTSLSNAVPVDVEAIAANDPITQATAGAAGASDDLAGVGQTAEAPKSGAAANPQEILGAKGGATETSDAQTATVTPADSGAADTEPAPAKHLHSKLADKDKTASAANADEGAGESAAPKGATSSLKPASSEASTPQTHHAHAAPPADPASQPADPRALPAPPNEAAIAVSQVPTPAHVASPWIGTSAAAVATSAPVPLTGVAVEIATRALEGKHRFEIRLDPPELGRIDVRLDVGRDGQVTSRLIVERAETLDLLRRDAPALERALQSAGLRTNDSGLEFSLRDQSGGGYRSRGDDVPHPHLLIVPDEDVAVREAVRRAYGVLRGFGGGVDIRV
jgi:flagellar hook-length control protein FliK